MAAAGIGQGDDVFDVDETADIENAADAVICSAPLPVGANSQPLPSSFMMNGSMPEWPSRPIAFGSAGAFGALVTVKSGMS